MFRVALYVSKTKMNTGENLNFKDFFLYEFTNLNDSNPILLFDKTVVGALAFVKELINLLPKAVKSSNLAICESNKAVDQSLLHK